MSAEVRVPRLAESISEAVLVEWLKADGAEVRVDEPIATLETDKAAVEIAAPEAGVLRPLKKPGDKVLVNDLIARIDPAPVGAASGSRSGATSSTAPAAGAKPAPAAAAGVRPQSSSPSARATGAASVRVPAQSNAGAGRDGADRAPEGSPPRPALAPPTDEGVLAPSVRRLVEEHGLDPGAIEPSGRGGRLLKEDVLRHLERQGGRAEAATLAPPREAAPAATPAPAPETRPRESKDEREPSEGPVSSGGERIVPMSRIRQRIAERLVRAQHTAAILTTFNEIDMTRVIEVRARHKESFEQRHGVKLGFMSFFARAVVLALAEIPELNAEIRGTDVVYRSWVHLGVAVGTDRGLIVPVIHDAQRLDFAGIEREIARLAERAREGSLSLEELSGGTFTISNGGVYGSLLSTPILNPPQSGILGMHKIEKRPVAVNDQVVIRPMMYVALSYDHRIVDGEQAVTFLVRVKERLEDPERILLEV